jgi:hypothetical protein
LISEPEKATPSVVIQALKLGIVRRLFPTSPKTREKWGIPGVFNDLPPKHFWQRRFYDFNVWSVLKMKVRAVRDVALREKWAARQEKVSRSAITTTLSS